jgi:putative secretion ATPase (PEP-CTERM system associated)
MYERFYQLRERPFALSPDPDYLYPSRVHREALSYLRYGIEGHAGFVVITGEIGSGKTTLLQTLLRGLDRETTVARLVNTMLAPHELLEAILIDFGLEPSDSKPMMLRTLAEFLVQERAAGRLVLLVIDEAQNLSPSALEEVRMLSNLETEKSKLIQIVLVGQPNLRDALSTPELEQLRQRVTVSYHLEALDADDTASYINHRLRRAAVGAPLEFPHSVTDFVHARSGGVPRIINVVCDAILLFGYGDERRSIDDALAREAVAELEATGVLAAAPDIPVRTPAPEPPSLPAQPSSPAQPAPVPAQPEWAVARPAAEPRRPDPEARPVAAPLPAAARAEARSAEGALREREVQIERREQELAAQRRVLDEEYRLLRSSRQPVAAPAPGASAPWPPVAAYPRPPVLPPPSARLEPRHAASAFSSSMLDAGDSLWQRVRRVFAGQSSAVNERS